ELEQWSDSAWRFRPKIVRSLVPGGITKRAHRSKARIALSAHVLLRPRMHRFSLERVTSRRALLASGMPEPKRGSGSNEYDRGSRGERPRHSLHSRRRPGTTRRARRLDRRP